MIFRKQISPHVPAAGIIGDCFRTCLACLLDMEPADVPHFAQEAYDKGRWTEDTLEAREDRDIQNKWLLERGFVQVSFALSILPNETVEQALAHFTIANDHRTLFMVTGKGPNANHICVYKGQDLLWDPAPNGQGLIGGINGVLYLTFLMSSSQRWNGELPPKQ